MRGKKSKVTPLPTRTEAADIKSLVDRFWSGPNQAFFDQGVIAAVRDCSTAKLERERCYGGGPKYIKDGRRCLYRKSDVVAFLDVRAFTSTSEYQAAAA